jgi:uncharacterized caspase-like protein
LVYVASTLVIVGAEPVARGTHRAFVVGINSYRPDFPLLSKCVQDAIDMEDLLTRKGYDVDLVTDVTRSQLISSFEKFCGSLSGAEKVLVHFSGHGFSSESALQSFLVCADSNKSMSHVQVL